jgi:hypothetical protein
MNMIFFDTKNRCPSQSSCRSIYVVGQNFFALQCIVHEHVKDHLADVYTETLYRKNEIIFYTQ